jgi:predicted nucleotidyltransferase
VVKRDNDVIATIEERLFKRNVTNEKNHLIWEIDGVPKYGVPRIDSEAWDKLKSEFDWVEIKTHTGKKFIVSKEKFDKLKIVKPDDGYGKQYYIERSDWDVEVVLPNAFEEKEEEQKGLF